jgi:hypothetical protein
MRWVELVAMFGLFATATPALAQTDPPKVKWLVDGAGPRCSLSRTLEGSPAATLFLRTYPGVGQYELVLVGKSWGNHIAPGSELAVTFGPGGAIHKRTAQIITLGWAVGKAVGMESLLPPFLDDFSRADSLALSVRGKKVAAYALPVAAKAVAALRECENQKLMEWGADPAGFENGATRAKPIGDPAKWLSYLDVRQAITNLTVGTAKTLTVARLKIGLDGRVEDCAVIASTGNERLDAIACPRLRERALYQPAMDRSGKAVRSVMLYPVAWTTISTIEF